MNKHVLLTGATGYIGRHLLRRLLLDGFHVSIIIRKRKDLLKGRIAYVLELFPELHEINLDEQLSIYEGDVTEPELGLKEADLAELAQTKPDIFIHSAGLTRFEKEKEPEIRRHNLNGLIHAYELCHQIRIPQFHHISTAFVAGNYEGTFESGKLDCGQSFKNPYEKAKYDAEVYLRSKIADERVKISIYRPSIVVGGQVVGETPTVTTLYTFLKSLHFIRECCADDLKKEKKLTRRYGMDYLDGVYDLPMRVALNPETAINLVSVFYVADFIAQNIKRDRNGFETFNLVGDDYTITSFKDAFCAVLKLTGIELCSRDVFEASPRTPIEERFFRTTRVYEPYLYSAPIFNLHENHFEPKSKENHHLKISKLAEDFIVELERYLLRKSSPKLNALALNCLSVEEPERYLDRFADRDFGESFMKRIHYVDARVLFRVTGENEAERIIRFCRGEASKLEARVSSEFDFGYEMDEGTFQRIVQGQLDPREALFQGSLKLLGDESQCLKLGFVFSEHFKNINDRILDELVEVS